MWTVSELFLFESGNILNLEKHTPDLIANDNKKKRKKIKLN